ncbi:MAG: amidase, partial [Alphaproteobacteria bacterium]|nr:amidase [Alphaproteobacteria bacterium]
MSEDLIALDAVDAVARLKSGDVSASELVEAALARIEDVNGAVNAVVTTCPEQAREAAERADTSTPLAGLPIVVKDLNEVGGVRTTYGSPIFSENVPERDEV